MGQPAKDGGALALGVLDLFNFVAGYDSGHGVKPSPSMALAFARRPACCPGLVLGALSGTGSEADLAARADRLLANVGELEELLDQAAVSA